MFTQTPPEEGGGDSRRPRILVIRICGKSGHRCVELIGLMARLLSFRQGLREHGCWEISAYKTELFGGPLI
jgi:hypothetical protein